MSRANSFLTRIAGNVYVVVIHSWQVLGSNIRRDSGKAVERNWAAQF